MLRADARLPEGFCDFVLGLHNSGSRFHTLCFRPFHWLCRCGWPHSNSSPASGLDWTRTKVCIRHPHLPNRDFIHSVQQNWQSPTPDSRHPGGLAVAGYVPIGPLEHLVNGGLTLPHRNLNHLLIGRLFSGKVVLCNHRRDRKGK